MDWEDAMEEAREELGYSKEQYVEDWSGLVEKAQEIYDYYKEEEYEDFCDEAATNHRDYLKSNDWKKIRNKVMFRDNFSCKDCGDKAIDVHHLDYDYLGTAQEIDYCVSLCRICHDKRHGFGR